MDIKVQSCVSEGVYADLCEIASANECFSKLKNTTVMVTGADGFVGRLLTAALLLRNDLFGDGIRAAAKVRSREDAEKKFGRLCGRDDLTIISDGFVRADYIIHLGGFADNSPVTDSAEQTADLLIAAKEYGCRAVLVVSGAEVYGTVFKDKEKLQEDDSGYVAFTESKSGPEVAARAAETLAAACCAEYGMHVKLARCGCVYGADAPACDRDWAVLLADAAKGKHLVLATDGIEKRSFCYVSDAAAAMLTVLLLGEDAVPYNIADESGDISLRGFAEAVCAALPESGLHLRFLKTEDENREAPLKTPISKVPYVLDGSRVKALGWSPKVGLTQGIRRSAAVLKSV